jgi:8-oxo-dGTP pyrophosphatase MutT (NUDIX family)
VVDAATAGVTPARRPPGRVAYDGRVRNAPRPVLEFSAGGLVIDDDGRVLLIRARDLRRREVWTLPKGTLVSGETNADAALREVREETGWQCEVVRELEPVTYWFQRGGVRVKKTVHWFLMRPLAKVGEHDHEVDEVLWTSVEDALRRLRYDSDRRLLASIVRR